MTTILDRVALRHPRLAADVSKVEDLQRLVDTAVQSFGRLDIMVNKAT